MATRDLTGQRFGKLVAIEPKGKTKSGSFLWLCRCDCGNEKAISSSNLIRGNTKSCGCLRQKKDLTGQKFGELEVIQFDGYQKGSPKWKCRCSCGNTVSVFENGLKKGKTDCGSALHLPFIGKRFGRLTVLPEYKKGNHKDSRKYLCRCDCGNEIYVIYRNLWSGKVQSCGCLSRELSSRRMTTHGQSKTRLYSIWLGMKSRCVHKSNVDYPLYGAVGIKVCEEWQNFENFYNWSMANGYSEDLTIDRLDNSKDYEPSNCRWATTTQQARNKGNTVFVEYNGETKTLFEWAEQYNIPYKLLHQRYRIYKWDFDRALHQPIKVITRKKANP